MFEVGSQPALWQQQSADTVMLFQCPHCPSFLCKYCQNSEQHGMKNAKEKYGVYRIIGICS